VPADDPEVPAPPDHRRSGRESLGPVTQKNRPVYLLVLTFIGVAMVGSVAAWIVMIFNGTSVPDTFPVVITTMVAGLIGVVSSEKSS
jgi:hypothetical protein